VEKYNTITVEHSERVAILTFNRPEVLNALNTEVITESLAAVSALSEDDSVGVVVLTGAGKAFVAGADIAEMRDKTADEARSYAALGHRLMNAIQDMTRPVIAAVNGFALGGGLELALACDIRVAADSAQFGLPETGLGVIPGWGATQRAARLIGPEHTKDLIFTGERISARRAREIGLVSHVVPRAGLMPCVLDRARKISANGPVALAYAKRVINAGVDKTLADGCAEEIDAFASCFETKDQQEGMSAFMEKRKPAFTGR
jgi:enoyl-CoA hydratase